MEPHCSTFSLNSSADLNEKLMKSLETFVQLYDHHKANLQEVSESFTQAAAGVDKNQKDKVFQGLFTMCGGTLGAVFGGVTGGVWGAFVAASAATYANISGDVNVVGTTFGFVGSMFGGVVGGALSGAVGSSVDSAALVARREVHDVVSDVLYFTVGSVTGGAIGNTFGGWVGAAGGAVGGGFGSLHATRAAVDLVGKAIDSPSETKDSKGNGKKMKKLDMMQKTGGDFSESIKPMVDELKTVQEICDKMASSDAVKGIADQTAKILAAVTEMEKNVRSSQMAADQLLSCVKEALSRCKNIPEELQSMREEVRKLLVSLKEC